MASASAVIISPDPQVQQALADLLANCDLAPISAPTVCEAERILRNSLAAVILTFEELPDGGFGDILRLSKTHVRGAPVIVFSRLADWDGYLNIVRAGAFDYVRYPPSRGEVERVVWNALSCNLQERVKSLASAA